VLTPIMISADPVMALTPATVGAMAAIVAYVGRYSRSWLTFDAVAVICMTRASCASPVWSVPVCLQARRSLLAADR
jgi:hypothetical protein